MFRCFIVNNIPPCNIKYVCTECMKAHGEQEIHKRVLVGGNA